MITTHDRALRIALGTGRKTRRWKNRTLQWSELLDRLSHFVVTNETMAQYRAMSRDRQAEIKDVGGFVGGYCRDGSRSDVTCRSVLCLDADYADGNLWPDFQTLADCAAVIYSTHKHTPEAPRLRLVIPLARDVTPDEYAAIGRRVAADLGIEKFDDTTYEAGRLMYWPSRSADGEEVFAFQDGPLLSPDEVLARYEDWRDVSAWPVSRRVADVVRKSAARQQDPLTKPGLIGAFCRTYSIPDAIERFLPEVYTPCTEPNRYTYAAGSTAGGAVVYEDKFLYSHHATDPAGGKLCNAFDLVRIHLCGGLDADQSEDTPPTHLPSYRAMRDRALEDKAVRAELVREQAQEAANDFTDLGGGEAADSAPEDWMSQMDLTQEGNIRSTLRNVQLVLENDPGLRGHIAWDEMDLLPVVKGDLPWRKAEGRRGRSWQNSDDANLRLYLETNYHMTGKDKILDGVEITAKAHAFHPVREYIQAAQWDGVPRVDELLIRYLGAQDNAYTRAVTRKTLVAAVARVFRPGVKFDYMLVIRGRQGIGKSSLIGRLAGEWFSDSFTTLQGKSAFEQARCAWIIEVGELAGLKKAEAESIKLFISKREDQYRPAYGRQVEIFPRQCIFIGTTNETEFLRDTTGNRRFWVVDTPNSDARADFRGELTDEVVRQIWAEAYRYYLEGEALYLSGQAEAESTRVQEAFAETDDRAGLVAEYLERLLPEGWGGMDLYQRREWLASDAVGRVRRERVCRMEIFCEVFGNQPGRIDRYESKAIHAMLTRAGWVLQDRVVKVANYGKQRLYERPE